MIVGIVGAGTMGAGIAQLCLQHGHEVLLHDVDEAAIARGRERVAQGLQRLMASGRLSDEEAGTALSLRLRDAYGLDALGAEADLVIEAALEDLELKRTIFRALDSAAGPDVLLATNTSALSVSAIAEGAARPERVLGMHFFNPAPVMALVEVVAAAATSRRAMDTAVSFVQGMGKTAVACRDAPGFIVNRVNRPFTLEALRMVEAGEASVEAIDRAIEAAGYPMGPFRLMDLVGIDINLAVARALYDAFDEAERFRPSIIQERMVAAARLGRKSGAGFYVYAEELDRSVGVVDLPEVTGSLPPEEIVARVELAIINEAYHAAGEDVADPPDIDLAMKLGANHPHGPFERAGQLGLRAVIDGRERLAGGPQAEARERFRVAPALWSMASL